ncbi:MAG: DNA cytosine methyltransferase [Planctomycetes bacterium]|nr:DNA cytosine methyltransferase [Planctomycetota bacterium]
MSKIPIISFFTGGGFLDLGLEEAGFSVAWTNEANSVFADMYEFAMAGWRRSQKWKHFTARISSRESILHLKAAPILREAFPKGAPGLFGVVGGPPCPDFSHGGTHSGHNGENGKLTKTFVEMIMRLQPHFFLIENVAGLFVLKKHRKFLDRQIAALRNKGRYVVDSKLLNALELGVPQYRERVFLIGCRKTTAERALGRGLDWREAGWFPWPEISKYSGATDLDWPTTIRFGSTPKKPRGIPAELTVHSALAGNGDPEKLPNGREFFNAYSEKFRERDEGDVSAKSFKRLHRYRYSPTAWYGNQEVHLHPWKPRRLSVREALRIQSVPDDYVLPAEQSLSAKFKLICNGVPCRMAEVLGIELRKFLEAGTKKTKSR